MGRSALVLTISDGVTAGTRVDDSGQALADRLTSLGFDVERAVTADETDDIARAVAAGSARADLVICTGGTGLGPRDRTPQALNDLLDYEIPGFGEQMRAFGRTQTPMADL
ncbi:MAG TPA: molybdopterin-binding protein, partial [Methylomirabilota bacterium]|nr:molybdopterin-binding protein [Methylomirabilota bacterium]